MRKPSVNNHGKGRLPSKNQRPGWEKERKVLLVTSLPRSFEVVLGKRRFRSRKQGRAGKLELSIGRAGRHGALSGEREHDVCHAIYPETLKAVPDGLQEPNTDICHVWWDSGGGERTSRPSIFLCTNISRVDSRRGGRSRVLGEELWV